MLAPLTGRHRVVLASVADPAADGDGRGAAATRDACTTPRRRAHGGAARAGTPRPGWSALGVDVVEGEPEDLPAALADHYLR